jgi:TonB family protein
MSAALLYRRRQAWTFWIAFACAAAIHVGAVVLAKSKSDKTSIQDFGPLGADVEVIDTEPENVRPQESVTPPQPQPQSPPDEETFSEQNRMPQPVRARRKTRVASFTSGAATSFGLVKALVMYAPRPVYPYEARRQRMTGSGISLLTVDPAIGNVTSVRITRSCGSVIIDNATLEAFRRWRFKPGTARSVEVPITYTLTGASY